MNILAHRGMWKKEEDKNLIPSLISAFKSGYGIETDVRDYCEKLVISHDIANSKCDSILAVLNEYDYINKPTLALNIKADGIGMELDRILKESKVENYFFFDMSFPEMFLYEKNNLPYFTRQSEFEKTPLLYAHAKGVWMDEFEEAWINESAITDHLKNGKMVALISPELHKRQHEEKWKLYKKIMDKSNESQKGKIFLCTDFPDEARRYFNV